MAGYGQFCAIARAQELLGGRWTMLVVREILCGSRRFNDIRRGIPRISRTVLSERLSELSLAGAISKRDGAHGPEYELTEAGRELFDIIKAQAIWGQRWLPRHAHAEDLDLDPVLVDMQRRVTIAALPTQPIVVRFEIARQKPRFLLLRPDEVSLCAENPGFPEAICLRGPLAALVAWWRGDTSLAGAQRMGLTLLGAKTMVRAFPNWFERYAFANVAPAAEASSLQKRARAS
jgi:DNA-binding HxlR family transcriptional regulator